MLSNGATSAWIVDSNGSILLPADQVRSRLGSIEEANYSLNETEPTYYSDFQTI
jgi:hypothetical protein